MAAPTASANSVRVVCCTAAPHARRARTPNEHCSIVPFADVSKGQSGPESSTGLAAAPRTDSDRTVDDRMAEDVAQTCRTTETPSRERPHVDRRYPPESDEGTEALHVEKLAQVNRPPCTADALVEQAIELLPGGEGDN